MKLKEFDIMLDIKKSNKPPRIEVVQNDNETNVFNIYLMNDIAEYEINDSVVEIAFLKSSEEVFIKEGVVLGNNLVKCLLSSVDLDSPGIMLAEVRIRNGNVLMTTEKFRIYVRKSIY